MINTDHQILRLSPYAVHHRIQDKGPSSSPQRLWQPNYLRYSVLIVDSWPMLLERVVFRRADVRDVEEIYRLEREIFGAEGYSRSLVEYLIMFSDFFVVACVDGEIVGYLCGEVVGERGHIITIAVRREFRKRGIGSMLMGMFLEYLRGRGVGSVYLEVSVRNSEAVSFYRKWGFYVKARIPRYYRDGSDAYVMERPL